MTSAASSFASTFYPAVPYYSQADIKPEAPKIAISRITRPADSSSPTTVNQRSQRISQACESCRRRRIRCPGEQPICSKCQNSNVACEYADRKKEDEKR